MDFQTHRFLRVKILRVNRFWQWLVPFVCCVVIVSSVGRAQSELLKKDEAGHSSLQEEEALAGPVFGPTDDPTDGTMEEDRGDQPSQLPAPIEVYMGRRIAQTMHFKGAEWLIRDEREREERCSLMLANLGVRPGMTVCDMGCGNGFYTLQLAKMTGKRGRVVGVDVQPEMLGLLRDRMENQGIENVIPVLGSYHNPHLPPRAIDLILLVDVYHEFSHPQQMLAAMRTSLKPGGLIVAVEYRAEDESVPIKPLHKMSKDQVNREMEANGFNLVSEFEKLPWQHMMFFGVDEDWSPAEQKPSVNPE